MHHMFVLVNVIPRAILRPMALFVTSITGVEADLPVLFRPLSASDSPMTQLAASQTFVSPPGFGPFSQRPNYPGVLLSSPALWSSLLFLLASRR